MGGTVPPLPLHSWGPLLSPAQPGAPVRMRVGFWSLQVTWTPGVEGEERPARWAAREAAPVPAPCRTWWRGREGGGSGSPQLHVTNGAPSSWPPIWTHQTASPSTLLSKTS